MVDVRQKKTTENVDAVNPIVAGIAGVVAGGIAVAAAVAMSDKNNQKKVKEALDDAKGKVTHYVDQIKSQPIVEQSTQNLEGVAKDAKKIIADKV